MSEPRIIFDPEAMFKGLAQVEVNTKDFIAKIHNLAEVLQYLAHVTYATGFNKLIKRAETEINQVGAAVVTANNSLNTTCKDVANQLVKKFAPQGAKSDYSAPAFAPVHFKVNHEDKVKIEFKTISDALNDLMQTKIKEVADAFYLVEAWIRTTEIFWQGTSADRFRHAFQSKVIPEYNKLLEVLNLIIRNCGEWLDLTIKIEAALGVE
jgi:hypothetical protein